MTPGGYLLKCRFMRCDEQPAGATDYVRHAGVFRVRVRLPIEGCDARPTLWVGFTAGGPLVERQSQMGFATSWRAAQEALLLGRTFQGY